MIIRLHGLSIPHNVDMPRSLRHRIEQRMGKHAGLLQSFKVVKRSIDARKNRVNLVFSVDVTVDEAINIKGAARPKERASRQVESGSVPLPHRPVVVGAGPAGLFGALLLASHGYRPVLIERGGSVPTRKQALEQFTSQREPDPECNALFGVGGAGTFSDGKLTTTLSHPWLDWVLEILVDHGAPPNILVDAKPHVGTDLLGPVVSAIIASIERDGGTVHTGERVEDLVVRKGALAGLRTSQTEIDTVCALLATGHSARDTWEMLEARGVTLEPKPFQLGVRVEHPQNWLDRKQYGDAAGHPNLGAADYKLATRVDGVPVFSFCMCPGGEIIPTINEPGGLCLNGMSRSRRDSKFANSGIVTTLRPEDHGGRSPSEWVNFARKIETSCFEGGGSDYRAPAQTLLDFARAEGTQSPLPGNSYRMGTTPCSMDNLLPDFVTRHIRGALSDFDRTIPGYVHPEAIVVAPEARASSPLRITRDEETRESRSTTGLYPAGEGSGYAGGIMSSALDGLASARKIIELYAPPSL